MPRANPIQPSFARGELSPLLYGRVDLGPYAVAAKTILNAIVRLQGPVSRRSGTRFVAEVKNSALTVRPVGFEFSTTQAYILEFGEFYLRAFMNEGRVVVASTDAAISNGDFAAGIAGWTNRSTGTGAIAHHAAGQYLTLDPGASGVGWAEQAISIASGLGVDHVLRFRVRGAAGDKILVRVGTASTGDQIMADRECRVGWHSVVFRPVAGPVYLQFRATGTKVAGVDDIAFFNGTPFEIPTPYAAAHLYALKFAQSADTLYIAHPAYPPHKLTRTAHAAWSLTEVEIEDGPFLDENGDTAKTIAPSAASGNAVTLTASGHQPFSASDVGRLVRLKHSSTWGYARIATYVSPTAVTADVKSNFGGTAAVSTWRLGAWSESNGYPGAVTFFEERLWWAGSSHQPQTVWSSRSGDFENLAPTEADGTVADDNAVGFTLAANQVNVIRWLNPGPVLQIGTVGGLWVLRSTTLDEPITPTNVQARQQRAQGCANISPREAGDAVLFVTRSGRKVRELAYSFERDKYVAPDMTLMAEHISQGGIVDMDFTAEPDPILWCARADGILLGMSYEREQEVVGWHRHVLGGSFAGGHPIVEGVAAIPSPQGDHNQLWLVVRRTIGGVTKRHLEFMEEVFGAEHAQADAFFVDGGLTYAGAPASVIGGLGHLEGEIVAVLADGAAHPNRVVSGGQVTLDRAASKVHVGLPFLTDIETLRPEAGAATGTAQGQTKRIAGVTLRLVRTLGCKVGAAANRLDEVLFRSGGDSMDQAPPLFTGDKYVPLESGHDTDGFVFVRQDQPLPLTLQAVMLNLVTYER
ncbi:MAG: hypothetical protein ACKVSF_11140 [Alphaproteobacteria bacterium]